MKRLLLGLAAASLLALGNPAPATAAVPTTIGLEGVLLSSGGAAAADGLYDITFGIYNDPTTGNPLWVEGPVKVSVKSGAFTYVLGTTKALSAAVLNGTGLYLSLQVSPDPELPRKPLASQAFAFRAAVAEALECSGCIKPAMLDAAVLQGYAKTADLSAYAKTSDLSVYAKAADLSAYAKTADLAAYAKTALLAKVATSGSYADLANIPDHSVYAKATDLTAYVKAASLAKVAGSGAYADLSGLPVLAQVGKLCGTGLVMNGHNADGSISCVASTLQADMIDEISNGLIFNQFVDSQAGAASTKIPDGLGAGVTDTLTFPDIGLAQKIWVNLSLTNSDLTGVKVELYGPGVSTPYVLFNGGKTGTALSGNYNTDIPLVSGNLNGDWLGKNIKGAWSITVKDLKVGGGSGGFDGAFSWSINIQTLSSKKIEIKGNLIVDGSLSMGAGNTGLSGDMVFNDLVTFKNSWCPTQSNGQKSLVVDGVCTPGINGAITWQNATDWCAAKHADICSGAQALMLRQGGALSQNIYFQSQSYSGNWINSYSDNDANWHQETVGYVSDDQGASNTIAAPCCYNYKTPARPTDQIVKVASGDIGTRVTLIHNTMDSTFHYAAKMCSSLNSDLCDKSQLVYLRTAGKITAAVFWDRSGEDNDGVAEYGSGGMDNDTTFHGNAYAFACCATENPSSTGCPAGFTDVAGVCYLKVNNAGATWVNAAKDCAASGTHICSVSQSSVLRRKSVITAPSNWTGSFNDCDGQCAGGLGIGSAANNLSAGSSYGYACCL
ncbi:MAG: hypothetical protein HY902_03270 [Deltaproteobacteria bacterium]|nr:hypothetical protein [Deltaproteobacteria bacterium]